MLQDELSHQSEKFFFRHSWSGLLVGSLTVHSEIQIYAQDELQLAAKRVAFPSISRLAKWLKRAAFGGSDIVSKRCTECRSDRARKSFVKL